MPPEPLDFAARAHLSEWMDDPCTYEDFRACLVSLRLSNRLTFNYRPTMLWLHQFRAATRPLHIVDVGSGGGDMLRLIETWATKHALPVTLTGIDLNPHATRASREFTSPRSRIRWLTGDALATPFDSPPDLILSSLLTHHLSEPGILAFLRWMERTARLGWFINDLHRDPVPYHAYRVLSTALRMHRFVRHDGPVSVRRAFRKPDWDRMLQAADLSGLATVYPVKPARLCVSRIKPHAA